MNIMKRGATLSLMALFAVIAAQGICQAETLEAWHYKTMHGKVIAVDQNARKITLKNMTGSKITFSVDPKVDRLDSIAVGDHVTGRYCVAYNADFRRPTDQEIKNPHEALGEIEAASNYATPGIKVKMFKDVVSAKVVDANVGLIALENSKGDTFATLDSNLMDKAKTYGAAIVTHTEPLIVSIKK